MKQHHDHTLAVRVTRATARAVREAAERESRSVSNYLRLLLDRAMGADEAPADHAATAAPTGTGPFCRPASAPGTDGQPDAQLEEARRRER